MAEPNGQLTETGTESVTALLDMLRFRTYGDLRLSLQKRGPQLIGKNAGRTEHPDLIV